jgi:NAD+ synthase (glutamine-hydrolysing)
LEVLSLDITGSLSTLIRMKIALAQINTTVGDIAGNCGKVLAACARARAEGAQALIAGEMAVCGYPPRDLLEKPSFIAACDRGVESIAAGLPPGLTAVVGAVRRNPAPAGRPLMNAALVMEQGRVVTEHYKTLLPTYDVFDEERHFEPAPFRRSAKIAGLTAGLVICEDVWAAEFEGARHLYRGNPLDDLPGVDIYISINASPFAAGKRAARQRILSSEAAARGRPFIYVNSVGGNDELVFDGQSFAVDAGGRLIARARAFAEDLVYIDAASWRGDMRNPPENDAAELIDALALGLRDYVGKCGFKRVVIGLSGGIDSAVTAALAARALGPENVLGVTMPSKFSSAGSVEDSRALAKNLGIEFRMIPIEPIVGAYAGALAESFAGTKQGLAEENIQARVRGALLMALSNKFDRLVLATGNKSELSVGYCTLYGDMCGGLSVIGDVPKTAVYQIAHEMNRKGEVIPKASIDKPPSAELRPDQRDTDSLPPYDVLDPIIKACVEDRKSVAEISAMGFDEALVRRVVRMVDMSEYKRKQAAPALRVTGKAFGLGRRIPTAQKFIGQ